MILTRAEFEEFETLKKVQLITSLPGAKPICLVGTISCYGVTNLAPFSSITHLGSSPALIGMVTRPATVERQTLRNIIDTKVWTINHVHRGVLNQAHQCSAKYPAEISEFDAVGLTEQYTNNFEAPAVREAHVKYGLQLEKIIDIQSNDTKLIIGAVSYIDINDKYIMESGGIDLLAAGTMASTALDTYFDLKDATYLPYARA